MTDWLKASEWGTIVIVYVVDCFRSLSDIVYSFWPMLQMFCNTYIMLCIYRIHKILQRMIHIQR